jgi:hypothetical protein
MKEIELLQAAIANTKAMLTAAEQGDWSSIAELEVVRSNQLEQAFPLPEHSDTVSVSALLAELIELNQQVETHCSEARKSLQTELSRFTQKKRAAAAYRSV